jgi:hypothetical protein
MKIEKADEAPNILSLGKNYTKSDKEYCILQKLFIKSYDSHTLYIMFNNYENMP